MYILCTKDEYRNLIASCTKAAKVKRNLLACKRCVFSKFCNTRTAPGESLSNTCVLVPENEDAFVSIDESQLPPDGID